MESVLIGLLRDLWSETWRNAPLLRDILSREFVAAKGYQVPETEWPSLQRDVLFLGLNAAYSESHAQDVAQSVSSHEDAPGFAELIFDLSEGSGNEDISGHFGEINDLIQQAKLSPQRVAYLHLFFCRLGNNMPVSALMDVPGGHDFLCGQLSITDWYIRHIVRPRVIVVVHAEACDYLGLNADWTAVPPRNVWMGYKQTETINRSDGIYSITAIHSGLTEESEQEPLHQPILILRARGDLFSEVTALLNDIN